MPETPNGLPLADRLAPARIEEAVNPLALALDPLVRPGADEDATVRALGTARGQAAPGAAHAELETAVAAIVADGWVTTRRIDDGDITLAKLATNVLGAFLRNVTGLGELRIAGPLVSATTGIQQPGAHNRQDHIVTHNLRLRSPGAVVLIGSIFGASINNPSGQSWAHIHDHDSWLQTAVQIQNNSTAATHAQWRGFAIGWGGFW